MAIPDDCSFVILGCTTSNLATRSYPFAIVVGREVGENYILESYVLKGWQNLKEFFPDEVRETVLCFLDDLASYEKQGSSSKLFFAHLHTLSVGSIRFVRNDSCLSKDLDLSLTRIFDDGQLSILWPDSFRPLELG